MSILDSLSSVEIVGLTLVGEARGEPIEGQVAVGSVIRNRFLASKDPTITYLQICLQPKQFSCWNPTDTNYQYLLDLAARLFNGDLFHEIALNQCFWVAQGIIENMIKDNTSGAHYYLAKSITSEPSWAKIKVHPFDIGNQIFFNV